MSEGRPPAGMLLSVGRGLLLAFAIALVAGAMALFVLELRRIPGPTQPLARSVAVANVPATGSSADCVPRTKALRVALVISKFDPVAQTVALDVYMCAQEGTLDELEETTH